MPLSFEIFVIVAKGNADCGCSLALLDPAQGWTRMTPAVCSRTRMGDPARPAISPNDVRWRFIERDRLAAADTRTPAQRWLGDPPPDRSALA
jgi:hypothetical protein